ncbi:hypothetical protein BpHYR1_016354 [Brachionus plicatilis]|uniref:Uncharacterized protein n=1 Tax=Brachionus plicatilis TaxID=10195 RepID=A0A3M7R200_BRAPC|nr:hypothetical protein BpHYR1_016354 [Brachionus plicatilis]
MDYFYVSHCCQIKKIENIDLYDHKLINSEVHHHTNEMIKPKRVCDHIQLIWILKVCQIFASQCNSGNI